MDRTRYRRVKRIFFEAMERPLEERPEYLARECADDAGLLEEVQRLLDSPGLQSASEARLPERFLETWAEQETVGFDADRASLPRAGDQLGHYRVVEKIGEGGMGVVYHAVDTSLDRDVAIKLILAEWASAPEHIERLREEARTVAALDHPNIIVVHAIDESGPAPFIVMELVRGQVLRKLMPESGLPLRQLLGYAIPIADAFAAAHASGVTHLDLKPENVMVTADGRIKLLDFGIAKRLPAPLTRTEGGSLGGSVIAGTPTYMSPEQLRGEHAGPCSDLFAFGTLLYELAVGERPFPGKTLLELELAFRTHEPAPPSTRVDVPAAFDGIVSRCLARRPSERPRTMAPVLDELIELERGLEVEALSRLVARSRDAADTDEPPRAPEPPDRPREVAVLPMLDLSPAADHRHFCVGIAEEIAAELSRVPDLRVAVVSRMDRESIDPLEMGRMLEVTAIIDGSVRRADDRMRISVRLVRVPDGTQLWSKRFDRPIVNAFAVQDEVARAVAELFDSEVAPPRGRSPSKSPEAYSAYLRGRYFWGRRYEDGLRRALDCFAEAAALDPEMAEAHAGTADCYVILGHYGYMDTGRAYGRARASAERALELDPELAEAHSTMGWIRAFFDWRWQEAERWFESAITLDPNYPTALEWCGIHWLSRGRFDEALRSLRKAWRLDPLSLMVGTILGWACFEAGQEDEADRILTTVTGMDPRFVFAQDVLGAVRARDREAESIAILERAVALSGREALTLAFLGFAYGRAGRTDDVMRVVEELEEKRARQHLTAVHMSLPYAGAGLADEALGWLEQAVAQRDSFLAATHFSFLFQRLHQEPRFAALVHEMGLSTRRAHRSR